MFFRFPHSVVVRKCVSPSLQEAIQVVPSNVVADIVAGGEDAHVAFDRLLGCKLVAFCIWTGSHEQPAGSHVSGRDALALNTALALANAGEGEQGKPDKEEGSSSDRDEDAPVNATQGLGAKKAREEADEGSEELEGEEDDEEDEEEEEEVEETLATNNAGRASSAVVGAGKSIRGLQAVLLPRHGSATPSTEYAGKSPVAGKRKHSELVKMDPAKLAAEILRLDEQVKNQKRKLDEVVSAKPGTEHVVVITQSYDELVATVEKALLHVQNTERVMRREAKVAAKDRSKNRVMREVLKRAAVRLEDCAASMKGVVVDSMENAQKKLTDEVARKIDGASSNIAGTAERAITTSGVTNSLNIIIAMLSGVTPRRHLQPTTQIPPSGRAGC
ncbi:unnamed protein product [Closterium sp. Naga37s-1]|nr:unnamed protein product [Closterium sp. Naga37s-1]